MLTLALILPVQLAQSSLNGGLRREQVQSWRHMPARISRAAPSLSMGLHTPQNLKVGDALRLQCPASPYLATWPRFISWHMAADQSS